MAARRRVEVGVFLSVAAVCLSGCGGRARGAAAGSGATGGGDEANAGNAGSPTSPAGGAPSGGGAGGAPEMVDPEVSRDWTWEPCGTLRPDAGDREALFDASGRIVVLGPRGLRVHDPSGSFEGPAKEAPTDFLVAAPDGSVLSGVRTPKGVELTPVGTDAPSLAVTIPSGLGCGPRFAFSGNGEYLVASGGAEVCAFRVASGELAGHVAGERGVMLDSTFVVVEREPAALVLRDLAGVELSRASLQPNEPVALSPLGNRAIVGDALIDLETGGEVPWDGVAVDAPPAVFSSRGEFVLVGDGVFRTSDGARVWDTPSDARFSRLWSAWGALSPDGTLLVLPAEGRATLYDVQSRGVRAVLGPPPQPDVQNIQGVSDLAISTDGALLVSNVTSFAAFGIEVAPRFNQSQVAWSMRVEMSFAVDVSADRGFAAIGGDGRAIYDGGDAKLVWPALPPPPEVLLDSFCLLDRFDLSPRATWFAGSDYSGSLQIFRFDRGRGAEPWKLHAVLTGRCHAPAFSRDERLLATSAAALYRLSADENGWEEVWSRPLPGSTAAPDGYGANDIEFSPDQRLLAVSRCPRLNGSCDIDLLEVATGERARAVPELSGPHAVFSPDGSWLVAGNKALHLASGVVRTFRDDTGATSPALFAPNGDIIGGATDGALTRYCRLP